MTTTSPAGAQRAAAPAPTPGVSRGTVAGAFRLVREMLQLPELPPPSYAELTRASWALAARLGRLCVGGKDFDQVRDQRRRIVALALAWAERMATAQTPLQLAERLPILHNGGDRD